MANVLTHNQTFDSPQAALAHYGKKGMKWGVITKDSGSGGGNAAKKEVKASKVAKAERFETNAATAQKQIDAIKANPSKWGFVQKSRDKQVEQLTEFRDQQLKDATQLREGRLTDSQRKILIGGAIVGGLFLASATYKYVDSGTANQNLINLKERTSGQKFGWKKGRGLDGKLTENEIHERVVNGINPGFGGRGTKMNCRRCTFAYEMRRRGYDVRATKSSSATGQNLIGVANATTPGRPLKTGKYGVMYELLREPADNTGPMTAVLKNGVWGDNIVKSKEFFSTGSAADKSKAIFDSLASQNPDGARGEVGVSWKMGGGHSMAYEIVGGKPVIFDGQSGEKYSTPSAFEKFADVVTDAAHTRLDNVTLNEEYLKRWVQNAD